MNFAFWLKEIDWASLEKEFDPLYGSRQTIDSNQDNSWASASEADI